MCNDINWFFISLTLIGAGLLIFSEQLLRHCLTVWLRAKPEDYEFAEGQQGTKNDR